MKKKLWITLSLINLSIVALLGVILRSKILFPLPFIDFQQLESAHSHFAFGGWAGLGLMTLMIYELLPAQLAEKKSYQWILGGVEISSLGMALTFPFFGYNAISLFFSTLYIAVTLVFAPVFIKDILRSVSNKNIRLLSISAIASLILSYSGTLGLVYILLGNPANSLLYRDSIYVFLHFQYNGFFTLSLFALALNYLMTKGINPGNHVKLFTVFLCISILPSLFLSLLWHNNPLFHVLAAIGSLFNILALVYFLRFFFALNPIKLFSSPLARTFWIFAMLSFSLKMLLNTGTIIPKLGDAIYGDRPVIIGFLHLVFLGFLTFYILSSLVEEKYFTKDQKITTYPLILFAAGIFANELILMIQGLSILFKTNNEVYKWLLWGASIVLFTGALLIVIARFSVARYQKKAIVK